MREGNRERIAGALNVAATHYGALIEGPLGKNASFFALVRKRYLDLLFKAFGFSFIPSYTGATVKVVWRPATRDAFSFLTIAARRTISFDNSTDFGTGDQLAGRESRTRAVLQRDHLETPAEPRRRDDNIGSHMDALRDRAAGLVVGPDSRESFGRRREHPARRCDMARGERRTDRDRNDLQVCE